MQSLAVYGRLPFASSPCPLVDAVAAFAVEDMHVRGIWLQPDGFADALMATRFHEHTGIATQTRSGAKHRAVLASEIAVEVRLVGKLHGSGE